MQAERGARGGRGRRGGRERPGGDREPVGAATALARGGCGDGGGRRGRGRGFRRGRGGGGLRGGRWEPGGRGGGASTRVEEDSDSETYGEENDEQGNFSRRKIVSNWDRYQDTEKEVNGESGESQRGTDFSVLLSSAGDSFSQFRFAEEKEWDGETSCPKQNSALYVDSESLVRALEQLPLAVRLNVASELIQTTIPLELPQVKPRRNDDGKELGMHLRGPISELRSAAGACPRSLGRGSLRQSPLEGLQKAPTPTQSVADHLEEELDMLLHLDAPVQEEGNISPDQTSRDQEPEKDGQVAQEETGPEKPSVTREKNVEPEQPSTSKNVTEEELEDWLDSMIS
ncbi:cell death regulator Aven isoform 1 [Mus musculus]|uniref:Cell death regulator Aven n=1 Tax=Mus musculus TaxID=10090 RepID=AVEN_MOUSE|nr:cell death regulator Aven isoform 1 [Mus musculus]Q9D9K3.2 RecName: Full=Cell death regulator Aven [Mus musculus]EDL27845.1 apoptosis, caspase activation inhibitor, isoform CRA_a [Mus musculus]|eukprot:NP_083120.2 cell death regulator Aven isoform 1 [Mus musculus]